MSKRLTDEQINELKALLLPRLVDIPISRVDKYDILLMRALEELRALRARVAELQTELANTRQVVFESAGFIPRPCTVESFHAEFERRVIETKMIIEKEFGAKMEAYGRQIIDAFRLDELKDEGNED